MTVQLRDERTERLPGPLPTLGTVGQVEGKPSESMSPDEGLEHLLGHLQIWFALVLSVSLPFIVYVLCSKGGFDLTIVTYPVLAVSMAAVTAIRCTSSGLSDRLCGIAALRWLPVQSIPVAGFLIWRFGVSSFYWLIPLFAVTSVFAATTHHPLTRASR
jgi:hypothetical protein